MKLPDGNVLISFSGGRTSGYMLHRILEANGDLPDRVRVLLPTLVVRCQGHWTLYTT